jgi:hypothetical protein
MTIMHGIRTDIMLKLQIFTFKNIGQDNFIYSICLPTKLLASKSLPGLLKYFQAHTSFILIA